MQVGNTRTRTEWGPRQRSIARARQSFIAADPREGRIMRQVRRAFIASSARPLTTGELLDWCHGRPRRHWHYWSIYRAAPRYAVKQGRYWLPR